MAHPGVIDVADRKLIIGYDGREHGDDALALGTLLAEALGLRPLAAMAVAYSGYLLPPATLERAAQEQSRPLFERAAALVAPLEPEMRTLLDDSPGHALYQLAERERAVVIAIGSAHRGPLGRILLGSVGEALLSGTPCAVAVAPAGYASRSKRELSRLGVAVDGSAESAAAMAVAGSLAERLGASLDVISVVPPTAADIGGAILSILSREELEGSKQDQMKGVIDRAVAEAPAGLTVQARLLRGDPATELARATEAEGLDLLLVGSRCYGPLRRALLGSVSTKLMRSSTTPVLVIPRDADGDPLAAQ
jgi:nucleotide-binding universal stress UspA family protein